MLYHELVIIVADLLKAFDAEKPIHKNFHAGIGPFGEPQLVTIIAERLRTVGIDAQTKRTPDLRIAHEWAIEFKIVRPFGDNGKEAENRSVNLLHRYAGSASLVGDALKLQRLDNYDHRGLFVKGYEHNPAQISLNPLISSFEAIAREVMNIRLGDRIQETRTGLVHPEHQVLRCAAWELVC